MLYWDPEHASSGFHVVQKGGKIITSSGNYTLNEANITKANKTLSLLKQQRKGKFVNPCIFLIKKISKT